MPLEYHGTISNSAIYVLVAPLHNENNDMKILKNSNRCWNIFPNDVLAELEISV
jgi:hypothetical protein